MANKQTKNEIYLTSEGLKDLKEELKVLVEEKQPKLIKRVTRARDFGDLTENAEYTNAREELSFVEGRIEELEALITKVKLIRKSKAKKLNKTVKLGCKVTVKIGKAKHIYEVVGEWEADPVSKKISHTSPLGKALLNKKKGDKAEVEAPAGKVVYEILEVH
jgi:transcription elongation factor GreA